MKKFIKKLNKRGFTLVEVLIVIGVIGLVAALTLPTLMYHLDYKVNKSRTKVFEQKFYRGTDLLQAANGIGPYYENSEEFLQKLSEHLKTVQICSNDKLHECFPYESIKVDTDEKEIKIDDIFNGRSLKSNDKAYKDTAALILADGTPMIISWKTDCEMLAPEELKYNDDVALSSSCVIGLYDINGASGPNKFGQDVKPFNGAGLGNCGFKLGTLCLDNSPVLVDKNTITAADCAQNNNYGLDYCGIDYYSAAAKYCGGKTNLPTEDQMKELTTQLYLRAGKPFTSYTWSEIRETAWGNVNYRLTYNHASQAAKKLSLEPEFSLWQNNIENGSLFARAWRFTEDGGVPNTWYPYYRGGGSNVETIYTVCLGNIKK